jgi:hypothetical protein
MEHLVGGQPCLVAKELRQVADPGARTAVAERPPEHPPFAAGLSDEAQEQLHGRRLAGAVGPEKPDHLARPDPEVERLERHDLAVRLVQAVGLDRGLAHARDLAHALIVRHRPMRRPCGILRRRGTGDGRQAGAAAREVLLSP